MDILAQLIIYALAAFRLSEMLILDDGPFEMFVELRGWFNRPPLGNPLKRNFANVLACVHCAGVWVSLALGIVYHLTNDSTIIQSILFTFAVAGLQSALSKKAGRSE